MPNKPNSGLGCSHRQDGMCETKPISGARWGRSVKRAKQSQFGPAPSWNRVQWRQTNPIRARGAAPAGRNARNKPNLHPPRGVGGASGTPNAICRVWEPDPPYTWVQLRQTNPILSPAGRQARVRGRGKRAKQSQFARTRRNRWGKPHPTSERNCAKQTQFRPIGRSAGSLGGANVRHRLDAPLRETNPIGRGGRADGWSIDFGGPKRYTTHRWVDGEVSEWSL